MGVAAADSASVTKVATDGSNAGVNITASIGTATTTEPNSGYYAAFTGSGGSKVTTAGWFPTGSLSAATSATTYFPITAAAGSVTMSAGSGSCDFTNNTVNIFFDENNQNNSGIAIQIQGSGSVSATAKITTAGYTPVNNSFATGSSTSSNTATLTQYVSGVQLVPPSSGTRSFFVQVPDGAAINGEFDYQKFIFTYDAAGNVWIEAAEDEI